MREKQSKVQSLSEVRSPKSKVQSRVEFIVDDKPKRLWTLGLWTLDFLTAGAGIAFVTAALVFFRLQVNNTTVALALLLVVLVVAAVYGSRVAAFASVLGVLCFNYYFLPPIGTLTISDPQNWIALTAFLITAIVAGQLSSIARRRAKESERLYLQMQIAFEQASEAEALRQSEKLKSALLDAVSHDLRTPLTSIKAAVTTLIDNENRVFELDDEGKLEFLEIIDEETDRLNNFIGEMVEMARIEAGEGFKQITFSDVGNIISTAVRRAERLLAKNRIKVNLEKDLPLIRVDSRSIAEVIYTLLDNAAKYSLENSLIEIMARRIEADCIEFSIADEGIGIDKDLREKVFDKFFRGDKQKGGFGMGLAIAKGIVEAHKGKIYAAENENKRGAKFVFTIPIGDE
ncbi:MAG: DUF4118 domain-containing protein [Pyrinomonadaceae bacterium]|nr:DUF4118 domain-containing protein [Pyrinomonadaceae bacterium]